MASVQLFQHGHAACQEHGVNSPETVPTSVIGVGDVVAATVGEIGKQVQLVQLLLRAARPKPRQIVLVHGEDDVECLGVIDLELAGFLA